MEESYRARRNILLDNKGFDLWADGYDKSVQISDESEEYPFAGYKDVLNTVYKIVREKLGTILDIGFGTGILTKKLYDDGYKIIGIDFSERMIEIAQGKMPKAKLIQYDFTEGLPRTLEGVKFDWIISTYSIHHLTDEQKKSFIYELMEHLNPGGAIVFGDVAFQTREDLEQAKKSHQDKWDEEEVYLVADEIKEMFRELEINYIQISYCSGVMTIR